ncbi:MAG TPA: hypothetical protein VLT86_04750 [Vicinamibacterales bacterium]|nr:hypothetical protein [Vicinamibacterales bacterium]
MRPRAPWPLGLAALLFASTCGAAPPAGDAAAQREDLDVFERQFFQIDHAFSPEARVEAAASIADVRAHLGLMSEARFVLRLAQIAALADNGHTAMIDLGHLPSMARVGLRLTPFRDGFFVVRAYGNEADLLGCRLMAIDDVPIARLRDAARTLRGGVPSWRDRWAPLLFERPGELYALGVTRSATQATYRLACRDGSTRDRTLSAAARLAGGWDELVEVFDGSDRFSGWTPLLPADRAPWALREFTVPFRRRDVPDLDAIVIQLHANTDRDGQSIAQFLEDADAERHRAGRANVVLDMRFNGGGNLTLTRAFFSSLPRRLPSDGRVIVLMSPWTFSAAISSIGYLKQADPSRVILVGEGPGDRLQFWAEGHAFPLPNTGALMLPATERHDYFDGCRRFADCHSYVSRFPIAVPSLAPEVAAPWTIDDFAAGRDPGMDAAARLLARAPRE